MPSSSTRTTQTELTLLYYFKTSYYRLDRRALSKCQDYLVSCFAEVLDMPEEQLRSVLSPRFTGGDQDYDEYLADCETLKYSRWQSLEKKTSLNVWEAGRDLAEVGEALFRVGREVEGAQWQQWSSQLEDMARQIRAGKSPIRD